MEVGKNRFVSAEQELVWETLQSLKDQLGDTPGVVLQGNNSFFFTFFEAFYPDEPSHVLDSDSKISWELIAASEVVLQALSKSESYWAGNHRTWDDKNEPPEAGLRLYRLHGQSEPYEYLETALKVITRDFALLRMSDSELVELTRFPSLTQVKFENNQKKIREFFGQRLLSSGVFDINRINDSVIDLILQKDDLKKIIWLMKYLPRLTDPKEEYESNKSNCLGFDALNSEFFFQFDLTQDSQLENGDLIEGFQAVFGFVFKGISEFVSSGTSFEEFLPALLKVGQPELEELLEPIGGIDLFFDHWDEPGVDDWRQGGDADLWVSPSVIQVFLRRTKTDPSFGIPTEHSEQHLVLTETRSNFERTKFEGIDPEAYIARLLRQTSEYSHIPRLQKLLP